MFLFLFLQLEGNEIQPSGTIKTAIPVPEDFVSTAGGSSLRTARNIRGAYTEKDMSLYQIKEEGRKVRMPFKLIQDGTYAEFSLKETGVYGLINQPPENELRYQAADYYDRVTGNNGQYADLQPGDKIIIPVKDIPAFADGNYLLSITSSGNRTKFMLMVNDVPAG